MQLRAPTRSPRCRTFQFRCFRSAQKFQKAPNQRARWQTAHVRWCMLIGFLSLLGRQPQSTLSVCVVACSVYTGRPSPAILSGLASRCQLTQQRDPFQHQDGTRLMRLAAGKSREYDKLVTGRAADRCTGHCEHEYGSSDVYQLACRLNTSRTPGHSWNDSMDQRSLLACAVLMVLGLIFSVNQSCARSPRSSCAFKPRSFWFGALLTGAEDSCNRALEFDSTQCSSRVIRGGWQQPIQGGG